MRKLILVAVILQLVITVHTHGFQFGDIISFKPQCKLVLGKSVYYQHYAVYVGDRKLPGKKDGQDIFERINANPACVFSTLSMDKEPEKFNYLDGFKDKKGNEYKAGTEAEITKRINKRKAHCGLYNVLANNCEHLATYVRYGVKLAVQYNMTGERFCINNPFRIRKKDVVKYLREKEGWHNNVAGLQVFPQLTLSACLALVCIFLM